MAGTLLKDAWKGRLTPDKSVNLEIAACTGTSSTWCGSSSSRRLPDVPRGEVTMSTTATDHPHTNAANTSRLPLSCSCSRHWSGPLECASVG